MQVVIFNFSTCLNDTYKNLKTYCSPGDSTQQAYE